MSAILFTMVIDVVCKPMLFSALISLNLHDEARLNPIPIQAFADDIVLVSHDINTILDMIAEGEGQMRQAGLEVKSTKCGVFYGRRSGNNWYTAGVAPGIPRHRG